MSHPTTLRAPAPARLLDIDALRGFALLGILVVNIGFLASTWHTAGALDPGHTGAVDTAVRWFVAVFFETKFYLLFSFLFGYSFTLQLDSAARSGKAFGPRFLRRLAGLFVLGALHAVFLFVGDILMTYATLGLLLLAVHRIRARTAVVLAGVLLGVAAFLYLALGGLVLVVGDGGYDPGAAAVEAQRAADQLRGGLGDIVGRHLRDLPSVAAIELAFQAPAAFAMFLLGRAAGGRKLLTDLGPYERALRRIQWVGWPVGLVGAVYYASTVVTEVHAGYSLIALGVDLLTAPALAAAYAATMLRWFHRPSGRRVLAALSPAGRMSLTNYLGQSLVCALVFTGFGLGLVNRLSPAAVLGVAAALFAVQLVASRWWMGRFRYGPVEWLLRAFTYWERPRSLRRG